MKYYVYKTTPTFITPFNNTDDNKYIIEHTMAYKFLTGTDDIMKVFKKLGVSYPKQLKWDNGIMIIKSSSPSPWTLNELLVIVCSSESAAERFEMQVLKNNLKCKKQNNDPFNMVKFNNYHNSKEKEKRLICTKYSK